MVGAIAESLILKFMIRCMKIKRPVEEVRDGGGVARLDSLYPSVERKAVLLTRSYLRRPMVGCPAGLI